MKGMDVMLAIGLFLGGTVILYLVWLLIRGLAVYAMPFWVGLLVFFGLYHHQPGFFVPLGGGILAATGVYVAWRELFKHTRSPVLRGIVALAFAAPSAIVAYLAGLQVAAMSIASADWRQVAAIAAALYVGVLSWRRIVGTEDTSTHPQEHAPA